MGTPTFDVEVGLASSTTSFTLDSGTNGLLGTGTLGTDLGYAWTSLAGYVLPDGFGFRRGATRSQGPFWRYEAGTATFTVDNLDGRFDPLNLSGPYVSGGVSELRPGLPVRVVASIDGTTEVVWSGVVDTIGLDYSSPTWSTVRFSCVDGVERLQAADLPELASPVGAGDTVAERLDRVLDRIGWPAAARDLDPYPANTLQATTLAQAAWTEMLLAADSDGGYLWLDRNGRVVWRTRGAVTAAPVLTFSSDPATAGLEFATVTVTRDVQQVANSVTLGRKDGVAVTVEDVDAQALVGQVRGYQRTDLVCETDVQVADVASWILALYGQLTTRVEDFEVRPPADTSLMPVGEWWQLVRLELGDTVRVVHATPDGRTIDVEGVVRGVEWQAAVRSFSLRVSLQTHPGDAGRFTLDDSTLGVLDADTLGVPTATRS